MAGGDGEVKASAHISKHEQPNESRLSTSATHTHGHTRAVLRRRLQAKDSPSTRYRYCNGNVLFFKNICIGVPCILTHPLRPHGIMLYCSIYQGSNQMSRMFPTNY